MSFQNIKLRKAISNSFVAQYLFEDNLLDNSSNGYNLGGNISYDDGISGRCIFAATTSNGTSIHSSTLTSVFLGTKPYTIAFWSKITSYANGNRYMFKVGSFPDSAPTAQFYITSGYKLKFGRSDTDEITSTIDIILNTWYHFAVTYDGDTLKLYINGELNNTKTSTTITSLSGYMYFPLGINNKAQAGYYDNLIICDRVLNTLDVMSLYGNIKPTRLKKVIPYTPNPLGILPPMDATYKYFVIYYRTDVPRWEAVVFNEINVTFEEYVVAAPYGRFTAKSETIRGKVYRWQESTNDWVYTQTYFDATNTGFGSSYNLVSNFVLYDTLDNHIWYNPITFVPVRAKKTTI